MNTRPLGRTGVMIPEIGVGTSNYSAGPAVIRRAIELGAALVDTAEDYGSEAIVGEAIRGLRDRVFVATKVAPRHFRRADVHASANQSLRQLGTDHIDLYQLHWASDTIPIAETIGAMEELVDAGKVRFIGVSNFSKSQLAAAAAAARTHPIVSNQVRYNLIDRHIESELLPYCRARGVTVIAYSPLAMGLDRLRARDPHRVLERLEAETGRTAAQIALTWCLADPAVVAIVKASSVKRVEENCAASAWRLSDAQRAELDRLQFERRGRVEVRLRRVAHRLLTWMGRR